MRGEKGLKRWLFRIFLYVFGLLEVGTEVKCKRILRGDRMKHVSDISKT
jgi:hypothetical protein